MSRKKNEYIKRLASLTGAAFQDAFTLIAARTFTDFQNVPAKPSGDGGLDGLSHGQTVGYCCYGLEPVSLATPTKAHKAIIKKFKSDLQRIFEVEAKKNKKIVKQKNLQIEKIIATPNKLRHVRLVCNHFEDHRNIGVLNTAFNEYRAASDLRFVDPACSLIIWGPKEIVDQCVLDDCVLLYVERPTLMKIFDAAEKTPKPPPTNVDQLKEKFDALRKAAPTKSANITALESEFLKDWGRCLQVMEKLNNDEPHAYKALGEVVAVAVREANLQSLSSTPQQAADLIGRVRHLIADGIRKNLDSFFPGELADKIAGFHAARLIGECPIDWRN